MFFGKSTPTIRAILLLLLFYEFVLKPSTLAHFELGILLANDVELALTLHNLAILASLLDGCLYFHDFQAI